MLNENKTTFRDTQNCAHLSVSVVVLLLCIIKVVGLLREHEQETSAQERGRDWRLLVLN